MTPEQREFKNRQVKWRKRPERKGFKVQQSADAFRVLVVHAADTQLVFSRSLEAAEKYIENARPRGPWC
jgi:hypothetical protein